MIPDEFITSQISRMAFIGILVVFPANIVCFAVAYVIAKTAVPLANYKIIVLLLGLLAISEIAVAHYLKHRILKPLFKHEAPPQEEQFRKAAFQAGIIIAAVCTTQPAYGLASIILGARIEIMAAFSIVSLAGFMLLRLRPGDFERLAE